MARSAKKRHQNRKSKQSESLQRMMGDLQKNGNFKDFKYVDRPEGMMKMSDAISEIMAPFMEFADTLESFKKLVVTACIAWNAANTSPPLREVKIRKAANAFTGMTFRDRQDFKAIIKELIRRKKLLYPDDKRLVVNYEVYEKKRDFHFQVAYMIPAKEYEKASKE